MINILQLSFGYQTFVTTLSVKEFIEKLVNLKLESKPYNFIVCCTNHETVEGVMRHIMNIFT